jgi:hypothetical protein
MDWQDIFLAAGSALLGALGAAYYLVRTTPRIERKIATKPKLSTIRPPVHYTLAESDARTLLESCQERLRIFQESREILISYTPEYGNTMAESGWAQFLTNLERVEDATETIANLLNEGHPEEAAKCAHLVLNQLPLESLSEAQQLYPKYAELGDWEKDCRSILRNLAENLLSASRNTQQLGIDRSHRRKATMQVSTELLRALREL